MSTQKNAMENDDLNQTTKKQKLEDTDENNCVEPEIEPNFPINDSNKYGIIKRINNDFNRFLGVVKGS